jgi:RHS repeat-associated protein
MPVAMTLGSGQRYYLAFDQVGSLRQIIDSDGQVQRRIDYDTFGFVITDTNPSFDVPFGFAGGLYDVETRLCRFGYRDYDTDTARWTAKDPILFAGGDTNLYGYCVNDPVNMIDTSGLFKITPNAGGHIPIFGPTPIAIGGSFSSTYNISGSKSDSSYGGFTTEIEAGSWADLGVSIGLSNLSNDPCQEGGATIGFGVGRYSGVQITLRNTFDDNRGWYNPLKYIDGISVGLGIGLGTPINITGPLTGFTSPSIQGFSIR